jgi:hypothetical protein
VAREGAAVRGELLGQAAGEGDGGAPGVRQGHAAGVAHEQRRSDRGLQGAQAAPEGGLRDRQGGGGGAQRARVHHREQEAQRVPVQLIHV